MYSWFAINGTDLVGASNMDSNPPLPLQSTGSISWCISQDDSNFKFKDENLGSSYLKKMNESRLNGTFCDVTIHVGDHAIKAHRIVLSAFSQYFEGLLNPNMREGKQDDIEIGELDGVYVEMLVNFAYTSEIELSPDNIQGVLETANFLAVTSVCEACCNYMANHMNTENCVGILQLADNCGFSDLRKGALKYCLRNFYDIFQSGDFKSLAVPLLSEILASESLLVVKDDVIQKPPIQEQIILNTVLQFMGNADESLIESLPDLLSLVRLPLISHDFLHALQTNPLIKKSAQCLKIINEALSTSVETDGNTSECKPRICSGLKLRLSQSFAYRGEVGHPHKAFDDKLVAGRYEHVAGFKIYIRRWDGRPVVGGFIIFYSNKTTTTYGNTDIDEFYEFHISDDERIVKVDVRAGWMIDQLTFYTNTGEKYGPFGGDGGTLWSPQCPDKSGGYLAFLKGGVVSTQGSDGIVRLQFLWGYIDDDNMLSDHISEKDLEVTVDSFSHFTSYNCYDDPEHYLYDSGGSMEDYDEDSNPYLSEPEYEVDENPYIDYDAGDIGLQNFGN